MTEYGDKTLMSEHESTTPLMRTSCDHLFSVLNTRFTGLGRTIGKKVCSIGETTRSFYVYHRSFGLKIYLVCKESDGPTLQSLLPGTLRLETRITTTSGWPEVTPYFIVLKDQNEIDASMPMFSKLVEFSREKQIEKRSKVKFFRMIERDIKSELIQEYKEGERRTVLTNRYERDPKARAEAVRIHGTECLACGFSFGGMYGVLGEGYIQVHHKLPLASYGRNVKVDPNKDLTVLCSNCHSMIHRDPRKPLSVEQLIVLINVTKSTKRADSRKEIES